ncbi:DEAD/DEAH box helicase [Prosthecomicrobium hirschii]|uniref:Type I restriction enzyme endonuclease subunit n=1 Tax=Prosthecodimorpha hirschii TaxID=665126 RepID=A0A0N8GFC6_9HYPH|nr:type I restriction endonuclease subunit R [Prosthecomicrobium hirschii]KPL53945.1 DEAD/DEAH box helicase [Prosthecomicrobium hirschii]
MAFLSETAVEDLALDRLVALGYAAGTEAVIGPDGSAPEREAYSDVLLLARLRAAVARLNPALPVDALADALRKISARGFPGLVEENRRLHRLIVDGVPVEYRGADGAIRGDFVRLVDFGNLAANDLLAARQFTVIEAGRERRPDIVLFVNGLPLAVIELKAPGAEGGTVEAAHAQLQTYKAEIPSLFRTNALLVASDGMTARVGSLTADFERFMPWRTADGATVLPKGRPELDTLLDGLFEPARFLALLRDFTVFAEAPHGLAKIVAGYHQFHAVAKAVRSTLHALASNQGKPADAYGFGFREDPAAYGLQGIDDHAPGDRRIGVIWHTQGSGKSYLMTFYAGCLVRHPEMQNPTIVVLTDRNDLDDQLFATFSACRDLLRQTPIHVESREALKEALDRASGGVIFTTIQKFAPATGATVFPRLSNRANIVVIADEAHRSQYGFSARIEQKTGAISYGFAKYLRDALPNASFIGFTGTPIEAEDVNTPAVFGNYIDVYDISRAVEDGATVPIYYESRLARIELAEDEKPRIDDELEEVTEELDGTEQEKTKREWATVEKLVGTEKRLALIAEDLVRHFEDRLAALDGKGMIVCMSRRICVALYDKIVALRPDWHSDDDAAGTIKIVMTGAASDPVGWQRHIGGKARRDLLAKRAKDPADPLKLVIVRDMWLTGFDAPSMHTMYVDKPMKGHGLMQAIARVNRVFRDKPAGLVVDYIGIAQSLKSALGRYTASDQRETGIDDAKAVEVLIERYEIVRDMYHGFDYRGGLAGTPQDRLAILAAAVEWILARQHEAARAAKDDDSRKRELRRYQDAVVALSKANALAASSDYARAIREEVAFFQTVRVVLVKSAEGSGTSKTVKDFAIQQLLDRAVLSTEIVDVLKAAGLETPNLSVLSDEFLAEVQQMGAKNLALEALRKLLNDEIRSRGKSNVVETKRFSERLEAAIARYHGNALTTVEVLQELIALAKDVRAAHRRGEEEGLSPEEVAFYDALAENESAVEVMGNDSLKVIAHELLVGLKGGATVDWHHRESARAKMRVLVKRILRKHGYPPDLQDAAIRTVLRQAELLSAKWAA